MKRDFVTRQSQRLLRDGASIPNDTDLMLDDRRAAKDMRHGFEVQSKFQSRAPILQQVKQRVAKEDCSWITRLIERIIDLNLNTVWISQGSVDERFLDSRGSQIDKFSM